MKSRICPQCKTEPLEKYKTYCEDCRQIVNQLSRDAAALKYSKTAKHKLHQKVYYYKTRGRYDKVNALLNDNPF